MRRSRAVVAVSRDIASGVCAGNWADPSRLHTVLNGVDLDQFQPGSDRDPVRRALGISPGARVLGTVARLSPEKDQATLLRAFRQLARELPSAHLMLVGDGALRSELERLARDLGLAERTHFLGERRDIASLLRAMDVFCLPSLTEGTSLTLLEAMATGLPVVATAVGGNPEVVADQVSGLLVKPGEPDQLAHALLCVFQDGQWARRLGHAGREIVRQRYSMQAMVERYAGIYQQVLS
jgi:glycosyltransferase involved in cell wall biosynthesis